MMKKIYVHLMMLFLICSCFKQEPRYSYPTVNFLINGQSFLTFGEEKESKPFLGCIPYNSILTDEIPCGWYYREICADENIDGFWRYFFYDDEHFVSIGALFILDTLYTGNREYNWEIRQEGQNIPLDINKVGNYSTKSLDVSIKENESRDSFKIFFKLKSKRLKEICASTW